MFVDVFSVDTKPLVHDGLFIIFSVGWLLRCTNYSAVELEPHREDTVMCIKLGINIIGSN
jgi:hypothetical protein